MKENDRDFLRIMSKKRIEELMNDSNSKLKLISVAGISHVAEKMEKSYIWKDMRYDS